MFLYLVPLRVDKHLSYERRIGVKITSFQAVNSANILESYSIRAVANDRRLYLTLARIMREVQRVVNDHEQAMNLLVRSYGKQRDEGGRSVVAVPDDKLEAHGKKMYEYLAEEHDIDLPGTGQIRLEAFEAAGIQPTAGELAVLNWLIDIQVADGEFLFS